MNDDDEHRYAHRGRPTPDERDESNETPKPIEQLVDQVEQLAPRTRRERARRVFADWIFPLLVLGAIGAAIVYGLLAAGVVSQGK